MGVDGSAVSGEALRYGARLAAARGDTLEVVTAWSIPMWMQPYLGYQISPGDELAAELEAFQVAAETTCGLFGTSWPVDLTIRPLQGPAAQVLIAESASAELLVLGRRRQSHRFTRFLGSTSDACCRHARCPVLLIDGHGRAVSEHDITTA